MTTNSFSGRKRNAYEYRKNDVAFEAKRAKIDSLDVTQQITINSVPLSPATAVKYSGTVSFDDSFSPWTATVAWDATRVITPGGSVEIIFFRLQSNIQIATNASHIWRSTDTIPAELWPKDIASLPSYPVYYYGAGGSSTAYFIVGLTGIVELGGYPTTPVGLGANAGWENINITYFNFT